jgi:hypothetical protein
MNIQSDATDQDTTVSIQIWVAGDDLCQAMRRRQVVDEHMNRPSVTHVGGGLGRVFYDLWCERTGTNPLALEGDFIADSQCNFAARVLSPADLAALTTRIVEDLRDALTFPVAVEVEIIMSDEAFSAKDTVDPEDVINPQAKMLVVITERQHATILAALRCVARRDGLEETMEADIATNGGQWDVMSSDEIDELGDRFNADAVSAYNVRL